MWYACALFFFSSRRRHTRWPRDWSSDVCSSDLTASAYAAQIGAMKANDEIDAMRVLGLNPVEVLVLPRVLAMMITLPILAFVGMIGGIVEIGRASCRERG